MKLLPDFFGNLTIGHFINGFKANDPSANFIPFQALYQFALCLARADDQDGLGVAQAGDDLVVVLVEVAGEAPVALVLRRVFLCGAREPHMLLHVRGDVRRGLALTCDGHDNCLPVIDPHAHLSAHGVHLAQPRDDTSGSSPMIPAASTVRARSRLMPGPRGAGDVAPLLADEAEGGEGQGVQAPLRDGPAAGVTGAHRACTAARIDGLTLARASAIAAAARGSADQYAASAVSEAAAKVAASRAQLPPSTQWVAIEGGNHARNDGGYMTMWAETQTTRFAAAVAGAGLSDWHSYYGENDIDQWMIPFFGASVYDDPAVYAKSSPIQFIKNVKTLAPNMEK